MALKLVFLGRLEETAGAAELSIDLPAPQTLAQLFARLDGPVGAALAGERVKLARNGALVGYRPDLIVSDGDELAFLPPVSGG